MCAMSPRGVCFSLIAVEAPFTSFCRGEGSRVMEMDLSWPSVGHSRELESKRLFWKQWKQHRADTLRNLSTPHQDPFQDPSYSPPGCSQDPSCWLGPCLVCSNITPSFTAFPELLLPYCNFLPASPVEQDNSHHALPAPAS